MAADSKATRNAQSMGNAQGEFNPKVAPSEPMTTKGHQPGQQTSPADSVPEFQAKTLPAGSAPASRTFQPDPPTEFLGQANNPDSESGADPLDLPGATSADVHRGHGHPGSGQTAAETRRQGQGQGKGMSVGPQGGSGMTDEGDAEKKRLLEERSEGDRGPRNEREHNATLEGAEEKLV